MIKMIAVQTQWVKRCTNQVWTSNHDVTYPLWQQINKKFTEGSSSKQIRGEKNQNPLRIRTTILAISSHKKTHDHGQQNFLNTTGTPLALSTIHYLHLRFTMYLLVHFISCFSQKVPQHLTWLGLPYPTQSTLLLYQCG